MQTIRAVEYLHREVNNTSPYRGVDHSYDMRVLIALLDVCKAFDKASRVLLISSLIGFGRGGHLLDYISIFLTVRDHCTKVDEILSEKLITQHGFAHGTFFAMFGFLFYIDSIVKEFHHAISSLFVDDRTGTS